MPTCRRRRRIGFCLNEKKKRKLNFHLFEELCRKHGYEVAEIDLSRPISDQGPFDIIIHKLSDLIVDSGHDIQSHHLIRSFQAYLETSASTILLDPLPAMRTLLDRFESYRLLHNLQSLYQADSRVFSPPYVELITSEQREIVKKVRERRLTFPFICKTRVAHGANSHEMSLIFNQEGLRELKPPCLLQSFINHNAVLFKVFVVGSEYFVVQRPSLKNFAVGESERKTITFNSQDVSKPESCSHLSELDKAAGEVSRPSDDIVSQVVRGLQTALGMSLFGVDLIVDKCTGRCAVIDVNAFPGYEGVPEFFPALLKHIVKLLEDKKRDMDHESSSAEPSQHPRISCMVKTKDHDMACSHMAWGPRAVESTSLEPIKSAMEDSSLFNCASPASMLFHDNAAVPAQGLGEQSSIALR
ncbi:inositol-tetrakisphosphate 1-kinase-like [Ambystoma mexicanum]|uniref:inositol-tetrakisphosphate 1-kinase-like n=1 Tax=Ambystoma mexicanum TaxID=8296 RepID=UPI0037E9C3F0